MLAHPSRIDSGRKDPQQKELTDPSAEKILFQCTDCGHRYFIAVGQEGSSCSKCGNVHFHVRGAVVPSPARKGEFQPKIPGGDLFRSNSAQEGKKPGDESTQMPAWPTKFLHLDEGKLAEDLHFRFQTEARMWAELIFHFEDPLWHSAYISLALINDETTTAVERYTKHRSMMLMLEEDRWQAEVADLMISRLLSLSTGVLLHRDPQKAVWWRNFNASIWSFFLGLRFPKIFWIGLGFALGLRLML